MADKKKHKTLGTIVLDHSIQGATQAGRTFRLPPLEFGLLQYAAESAATDGLAYAQMSAPDLLKIDSVWPASVTRNAQNLEAAIKQLRKKFDPRSEIIFPGTFATAIRPGPIQAKPPVPIVTKPAKSAPAGQARWEENKGDHLVGTVFNGKYELLELIGGGASGNVYRGRHVGLNRDSAIKVMHLDVLHDSEAVRRFQREAKLTAKLSHINIVEVRDFGLAEHGSPYLVMELVDGSSLADILPRFGRPLLSDVVELFSQACAGLEHAHNKGFVHRDIKPSNLMILNNPPAHKTVQLKIVDFGLARRSDSEQDVSRITQSGVVVGSPSYMSPEQCRGEEIDRRSDVYSLGCALYETLSGRPPFAGPDAVATLVMHATAEPAEIEVTGESPLVQLRLNKILKNCLAKKKEARYQTAAELAQDLQEAAAMAATRT